MESSNQNPRNSPQGRSSRMGPRQPVRMLNHQEQAIRQTRSRTRRQESEALARRHRRNLMKQALRNNTFIRQQLKASLKMLQTRKIHRNSRKDGLCTICMERFKTGRILKKMPCQHEFHKRCLDRWLWSNYRCPICREYIQLYT